jgi:hypothetical protein
LGSYIRKIKVGGKDIIKYGYCVVEWNGTIILLILEPSFCDKL